MNTTNAIATIEQVRQKTAPPLKKDEVLKATAQAMADDHAKAVGISQKTAQEAREQFEAAVIKHTLKNFKQGRMKFSNWHDYDERPVKELYGVSVGFELESVPELKAAYDKLRLLQKAVLRPKGFHDFLGELRAASAGKRSANVESILSDTKLRKQLLEAGKQLLSAPTAEDKASAIPA